MRLSRKYQGDKSWTTLDPDYENHDVGEKTLAASPSSFINPSIQQPEMMGRLRLSSIDPRSEINK